MPQAGHQRYKHDRKFNLSATNSFTPGRAGAENFTVAAWEGHGLIKMSATHQYISFRFSEFGFLIECGTSAQGLWSFARRVDPCRRTRALVVKFPCWTYIRGGVSRGRSSYRSMYGNRGLRLGASSGIVPVLGEHVTFHKLTSLSYPSAPFMEEPMNHPQKKLQMN